MRKWFYSVSFALVSLAGLPAFAAGVASVDAESSVCWQSTDRSFTVKECIEDLRTSPVTGGVLEVPENLVQTVSAELAWAPSLVEAVLNHGSARGRLTRTATLDGVATDLGSHFFATDRNGGLDRLELSIRLRGHDIHEVQVSLDAEGTGSFRSVGEAKAPRTVEFERGLPISDSGDTRAAAKSSFYMGCFIDTPAYDQYRADNCFLLGSSPSTASFKFFLPYTPSYYVWYNPGGCSGQWCTVPISPGQTISGSGYWVINGIPTGPVSATAHYFFEPGF